MRKTGAFFFLIGLLLSCRLSAQSTVATTRFGKVKGYAQDGIKVFKGIPFAAPPVGALRWQPPQPPAPWKGIKACTAFSASPMQPPPVPFMMWTEEFIAPPTPLSEDCLYLNVWTSSLDAKARLPVFVWIYGGGFSSGSAACAIYDGAAYAKEGVVFVSLNYRVGVLGFMAHPELSRASASGVSGNYGLLDQRAALQWIQENIASFGGDPDNVTIAGQSAGSMSVNSLVASSLTKGLFQKAIAQSGGLLSGRFTASLAEGEKIGTQFQKMAGASSLEELRAINADSLVRISMKMGALRFGPLLDGYVLPQNLHDAFSNGSFNDVPFIGGWVTGDGALFPSAELEPEQFIRQMQETYGNSSKRLLDLLPHATTSEVAAAQQQLNLLAFAVSGMYRWASFSKKPAYIYEYSHVPPDKPGFPNYGAFHTSEVPYALKNLDRWNRSWQTPDRSLENDMSSYWLNFIRKGDPNGNGLPPWKPFTIPDGSINELGDRIESKKEGYTEVLQLLKPFLK